LNQDGCGNGDRCAETRGAFKKRAERKSDQDYLDSWIWRKRAQAVPEHFEQASLHRELVKKD